jgi:hypothetical protein
VAKKPQLRETEVKGEKYADTQEKYGKVSGAAEEPIKKFKYCGQHLPRSSITNKSTMLRAGIV